MGTVYTMTQAAPNARLSGRDLCLAWPLTQSRAGALTILSRVQCSVFIACISIRLIHAQDLWTSLRPFMYSFWRASLYIECTVGQGATRGCAQASIKYVISFSKEIGKGESIDETYQFYVLLKWGCIKQTHFRNIQRSDMLSTPRT